MTQASDVLAAEEWLAGFARKSESSETLDYLVTVLDNRIVQALPEFVDPTLRAELHASTRAHWKGFLAVVTRETIDVQPAPQITDLARTLALRGHDLPVLLAVYRIGQRALWEFITGVLQDEVPDPAVRSAVLLRFWSHAARWIDCTVEALIVVFTTEREQRQRGAIARRAAVVHTILARKTIDIDAAAAILDYPLHQCHIAFTLKVDHTVDDPDVQRILESSARSVGAGLGGGRPLVVSSGARSAWCWTALPRRAGFVPDIDCPHAVFVTVGNCHSGPEGFRLSHTEAVATLQISNGESPHVERFADVEIACLAMGILDAEARVAFVRRELGELAADDDATDRLRSTLRVYLRQGGDASLAGELLRLHPNTVRYRIRQAEKKIGHPIGQRRVQIELALAIVGLSGISL
jgi:hypothetical protein